MPVEGTDGSERTASRGSVTRMLSREMKWSASVRRGRPQRRGPVTDEQEAVLWPAGVGADDHQRKGHAGGDPQGSVVDDGDRFREQRLVDGAFELIRQCA